jgi:hypothetical protein
MGINVPPSSQALSDAKRFGILEAKRAVIAEEPQNAGQGARVVLSNTGPRIYHYDDIQG